MIFYWNNVLLGFGEQNNTEPHFGGFLIAVLLMDVLECVLVADQILGVPIPTILVPEVKSDFFMAVENQIKYYSASSACISACAWSPCACKLGNYRSKRRRNVTFRHTSSIQSPQKNSRKSWTSSANLRPEVESTKSCTVQKIDVIQGSTGQIISARE